MEGADGRHSKKRGEEKKEKREQAHDTERKRTRGTRRENGKNEGGSLLPANRWPPQFTAAPIRDPEGQLFAPPGYRRRRRKGRGPARLNTERRKRPRVSVPAFVLLTRQQKRQICDVGWQGAASARFPPSSTLTLFHSGVFPPDAELVVRGERGTAWPPLSHGGCTHARMYVFKTAE